MGNFSSQRDLTWIDGEQIFVDILLYNFWIYLISLEILLFFFLIFKRMKEIKGIVKFHFESEEVERENFFYHYFLLYLLYV